MVQSLLSLSALKVVSDYCLLAERLSCVPSQLYWPLLNAAFTHCRPLTIVELVRHWPEPTLSIGHPKLHNQRPPEHLCVSALLLAVVRGLTDKRCCLRELDLCGLQCEVGRLEDPMYRWSLTRALCYMLLQTRNIIAAFRGCRQDELDEKKRERERNGAVKRDRSGLKKQKVEKIDCSDNAMCEQNNTNGVRRKMKWQKRTGAEPDQVCSRGGILVDIIANLYVNSRSWSQVRRALKVSGPLRLHCRYLNVEDLPACSIISLLHLLPQEELFGVDLCKSSLGMSELLLLLPQLASFPQLGFLRLRYCNLDMFDSHPGKLQDLSRGFGELKSLRRLSLIGLRLTGLFQLMLSSLSEPLEALELLCLSLTSGDMEYLSHSPHSSSLSKLDLSGNRLDEFSLDSLGHLLAQAECSLLHLSLCDCGLSDDSVGPLLPSLGKCRALRSLRLALNPLSRATLVGLAQAAAGIQSLRLFLYPIPLEEYQPGLSDMPSYLELIQWPLIEDTEAIEATVMQLDEVLRAKGRTQDLLLTSNISKYGTNLEIVE